MARSRFFKDEEEEKKRAQQAQENNPAQPQKPAQPQPAAPKPATNYAGVRSGAKGKVATQEEWNKTQNIAKTRQALEQTDYKVTERNWDKNDELGKRRYNARLARHAVGLKTEQEKLEETPNKMKIDFRSIKDNNQAVYVAASLHGKAKSQFLKDYAKYSKQNVQTLYALADEQEGLFTSKMSTKGQLKQLGLYTINGDEIDVDTASPDAIVQGIRDIADPDKRETAIKLLQSMTRDEDSRFYGYNAYSQDYSFRDSAVLTEAGYKKYAKDLEGMFDPREDMLEDSLRAYANAYADLEDQGAYVLAQELPLLEEAFKKQMGVSNAPDIDQLRKMLDAEDSIRATRQALGEQEEEKKTSWGRVKAWFDDFSLKNVFGGDDEEEEEKEPEETEEPAAPEAEKPGEIAMETQEYPVRRVASASSDASRIFSEKATDTLTGPVFPEIPEEKPETQGPEWKPEQSNAARATAKVNMTDDPVGALVDYVFKGNGDQLDDATKEVLNQYAGNAEMRALLGILDDKTGAEARAGNANIKYAVLANTALLGPMAEHAQKLHSKGYLADLADDAEALLVDMVHEASTMELTDEELAAINAGDTNRCTIYCEKNPDKLSALNDAFAFSEERTAAAREQKVLDAEAALDQARTRCRTGYATESDWEMVYAHAPVVPRAEKRGDNAYAQTFGMIDQMLWEANESGDMSSWFNSQAAKYLSENGAYVDVSSKEALKFKADLQEYMWEALGSDYDVAYALGYDNLDAFWKATGTGSVDALQAKAIALYEADLKQMSEDEESLYQGDGSTGTGEVLVKGAESGIVQNLANNLEALATLGVITDNEIERFEVRDFYYSNGSFVDAEARCKADLYAMLEGGYFPNEEVAKHIREYLDAGGMALDLGIMPSKFGWTVAKNANEQKQRYEDLVEWSYENLTSGQGKVFGITASTVSNTMDQAESFLLSLPLAAAPGVSTIGRNLIGTFNMMMAYGAPTYLEGVNTALAGGADFAGANMMGASMAFAQGMAETFTDLGIADDALRAMGVKDLLGAGMEQAGSTAARRWWHATKAAIKQTAEVAAEEVTKDEFFEGVFTEGAKAGTWKAIELTNGFTELPNPSQLMKIAGAALKGGVNAVGPTTRELVDNLGENLIATLPIAMISGGISGVGDWRSTRDIKTAMTTGDPKDVAQAGESLVEDMSDPEKAAAVDKAAADIRVNKIASDILVADEGEIGSLMARARAAREQAKSHEATLLKSLEANRAAQRAMAAAQAKIDSGDVSATALQELNDATEAYAKSRNNMDESQREFNQKKAESDSLHGEAITKAKAEASKQVQQERAAVAQNVQTAQEARVQEQEAAAVAQEETNSYEMEADAWLDAQHKDAPEAERAKLRQRYIDRAKQRAQGAPVSAPETSQQTEGQIAPEQRENLARVERFARSVGKRFGVNISFEDRNGEILRGNRGGYSRKANTIYLPKDAAQGDVVRAVFSHELTHRAEESKFYREMADALLEWKYGDNVKQREADRKARYDLYKPQYQNTAERAAEFERNGDAIAESEQVARIAEELFAADEKALDRLVESKPGIVRRIADTIKEVIDRFRGVKDPQLDAMRRVEKYMRKALDEVEKKRRSEYAEAIVSGHNAEANRIIDEAARDHGLNPNTVVRLDATGEPLPLEVIVDEKFNDIQHAISYEEGDRKPDLTLKSDGSVTDIGQRPKDYVPKKIGYAYKLMEQHPDGTLHALFAGTGKAFELGTWNWAEGFSAEESPMVSEMNLFPRYGWHMGTGAPSTHHLMGVGDVYNPVMQYPSKTSKGIHPKGSKRVWCRVAYDATNDYNAVADNSGTNGIRGLIPFGGYYAFQEGNLSYWILSSALKFDKVLTEEERAQILKDAGVNEEEMWQKQVLPKKIKGELTRLIGSRNKGQTSEVDAQQRIDRLRELWDGNPNSPYSFDEQLDYTERKALGEKGLKNPANKKGKMTEEEQSASRDTIASSIVDNPEYTGVNDIQYAADERNEWYDEPESKAYVVPEIKVGKSFEHALTPQEFRTMKEIIVQNPNKYMSKRDLKAGKQKMIPVVYHRDITKLAILGVRNGQYEISDIYKLNTDSWDGRIVELLNILEKRLKKYGNRGYESWSESLRKTYGFGLFSRYDRQILQYPPFDSEGSTGTQISGNPGYSRRERDAGRGVSGDSESLGAGTDDIQYAVPEDDLIDQQIDAWIDSSTALEPRTQLTDQTVQYGDGERQFATQTAQRSEAMPDWLKENLFSDPEQRYYQRDTNDAQLMRAWNGILNEGYDQTRDRILSLDHLTTDDIASANVIMAMAFRNNDMNTAMLMAHKYNSDGTLTGQALQARRLFSRMTPTGLKAKVAGEYEAKTEKYIKDHKPSMKDVRKRAQKKADKIRNLQGGDELLRLTSGGSYTIKQNKWNMPLNEQQLELIKQYKLEKVARPGLTYNRATTKQRMLEAILATPNPLELTGNGLNLIERLEMLDDGLAVVTNADLNYIGERLAEYAYADADTQQGREGDLALSRAYEAYGNIDPATLSEKMRTWGYVSMLLSVPSAMRNVIGNSGQNALNAAADAIAVELDRAVSLATGERTRAHLTMRERADGWHAFAEETKNTWRDYFADKAIVQKGEERFSMNQRGRVYQSDALEAARIVEGFLMSVGDRNFWKKKYVNSMAEQMRIAELNGVEFDYDAAVEIAEAEANYATFNEDSKVRDLLAQAKQIPGIGWLIHFAMPFTGVPTNIAKRSLQYSPLGLVTTAVKLGWNAAKGKTFDQRAFVNGMARGLTGTAMWGLGMALMKAGLIHLGTNDDEDDLYNLNTAQGEQYSPYIQVGDEYVSLAAFAPSVSAMVMGAKCAQLLEKDDDLFNALYNSCFASLDQIIDASYLSGLQDMFDAYGEGGVAGVATSIAASAISQNTPALLRQIATALDPYTRDTKDANDIMAAVKYAAAGVPFLREEVLPAKVDVTGEKVASKEGWRNFLDPFTTTKVRGDATLDELERLWRDTGGDVALPTFLVPNSGKITILAAVADKTRDMDRSKGENKLTLTSEQRVKYNEMYGKQVFAAIKKTVESKKYQRADDAERVQMLADLKKNELQGIRLDMQRQICIEFGFTF